MAFEDTKLKLEQWAIWANQGEVRLGFGAPMASLLRQCVSSSSDVVLFLSDDDAEGVDLAVGQLKKVDLICYECIILRYRLSLSTAKIARQLKQSRPTVEKNLFAAEAWLDRALSGFDKINLSVA